MPHCRQHSMFTSRGIREMQGQVDLEQWGPKEHSALCPWLFYISKGLLYMGLGTLLGETILSLISRIF